MYVKAETRDLYFVLCPEWQLKLPWSLQVQILRLTFELPPDMAIVPWVLLFIVVLELVEWLKVLEAQRAKKALLHFARALKGWWITGGHDSGVLRCWKGNAKREILVSTHMSRGEQHTPYWLHHARENTSDTGDQEEAQWGGTNVRKSVCEIPDT